MLLHEHFTQSTLLTLEMVLVETVTSYLAMEDKMNCAFTMVPKKKLSQLARWSHEQWLPLVKKQQLLTTLQMVLEEIYTSSEITASRLTTEVSIASLRNHWGAAPQPLKWTHDTKDKETHGEQMVQITQTGLQYKQWGTTIKSSVSKEGVSIDCLHLNMLHKKKVSKDSSAQESKNYSLSIQGTKSSKQEATQLRTYILLLKFRQLRWKTFTQLSKRNTTIKDWHQSKKVRLISVNRVVVVLSFVNQENKIYCIAIKVYNQ